MTTRSAAPAPPPEAFLHLAGHPLRWRLLQELGRSDRMVQELTEAVGEPQNLVSYHLGKLRRLELVSSRRSSADGRDTYYTLDAEKFSGLLSAAGGAIQPGLRLSPDEPDAAAFRGKSVLFLCTGNSARSQMAEAILRARSNGAVDVVSAGSAPKPLHPNAVRVLSEAFGIDISGSRPKHMDMSRARRFDRVVSLCDRLKEDCLPLPGQDGAVHWSIPNPATGDTDAATYPLFLDVAQNLERRIRFLLAGLAASGTGEP